MLSNGRARPTGGLQGQGLDFLFNGKDQNDREFENRLFHKAFHRVVCAWASTGALTPDVGGFLCLKNNLFKK